jgi:hypothetical protein
MNNIRDIRAIWFKNHVAKIQSFDDDNLIRINWRHSDGNSNYAVLYIIDRRTATLFVSGDLGQAVYRWGGDIGINFIAGCDIGYFNEKCCASSCGERGKTWSEEVAVNYVKQWAKDNIEGLDDKNLPEYMYDDGMCEELSLKTEAPELVKYFEDQDAYKHWKELSDEERALYTVACKKYIESPAVERLSKNHYISEHLAAKKKYDELMPEAIRRCWSEHDWHEYLREDGYKFFGDGYYECGDIGETISIRIEAHLIGMKMIRDGIKEGKFQIEKPAHVAPPAPQIQAPKSRWRRLWEGFIGDWEPQKVPQKS